MKIRNYNNIEVDFETINAWKDAAEFPFHSSSPKDIIPLKNISVSEIIVESNNRNKEEFDHVQYTMQNLTKVLLRRKEHGYLFVSEHKKQIKNRLRSYKGIPILKATNGMQREYLLESGNTIISGMVDVNTSRSDCIFDSIGDSSTSFLMSTDNSDFLSEKNLDFITTECMEHRGRSVLNYLKLVGNYCNDDNIIFRMAGDGGVRYVALQLFYKKQNYIDIVKTLYDITKVTI
jgi:hypothetical protein